MHETTVRFSDELWARVQRASKREGTSAAQFVREATVARIAVDAHVALSSTDFEVKLDTLGIRVERIEETLRRHGLR